MTPSAQCAAIRGPIEHLPGRIISDMTAQPKCTCPKRQEAWIKHNESEYVIRYSPPLNMTRLG